MITREEYDRLMARFHACPEREAILRGALEPVAAMPCSRGIATGQREDCGQCFTCRARRAIAETA